MTNPEIFDDPIPAPASNWNLARFQKIAVGLELCLLAVCAVGLLLKWAGRSGGSEFLIIGSSSLVFVYLPIPILIFGSAGWKRHVAAHLCGLCLAIGVMAILFLLQSWKGMPEMAIIGFLLAVPAFVLFLILYFARKNSPRGNAFFRNLLIRLGVVLAVLAKPFLAAMS